MGKTDLTARPSKASESSATENEVQKIDVYNPHIIVSPVDGLYSILYYDVYQKTWVKGPSSYDLDRVKYWLVTMFNVLSIDVEFQPADASSSSTSSKESSVHFSARGCDSAKLEQVIVTRALKGSGTPEDVLRIVTQYWTLEGELIYEKDE